MRIFSRQEENSGIRRPFAELSTDFPLLNFLIHQRKLKFNWIKGNKKRNFSWNWYCWVSALSKALNLTSIIHCAGIFAERIRHGGWWAQNKKLLKVCFANKTSKSFCQLTKGENFEALKSLRDSAAGALSHHDDGKFHFLSQSRLIKF